MWVLGTLSVSLLYSTILTSEAAALILINPTSTDERLQLVIGVGF